MRLTASVRAAGLLCEQCEWPWIRVCECVREPEHVFACMRKGAWLFPHSFHMSLMWCEMLLWLRVCVVPWAYFWFCVRAHMPCLCVSKAICRSSTQDTLSVSAQVRFAPPATGDFAGPHQVWFHQPQETTERGKRVIKNKPRTKKQSQLKFICIAFDHSDSLSGLHRLETKTAPEVNKKKLKRNL